MKVINWGLRLKQILEAKGMSQSELANQTGLSESYISRACKGHFKGIQQHNFELMARALSMTSTELSRELKGNNSYTLPKETPEKILDRFRISMPATVPIYEEFPFHAGISVEPADFIAIVKNRVRGKMLEAYTVRGQSLEPEIKEGDIIVVDRDGEIDNGDIVACLVDSMLHLARLRKIAGEAYLENNHGRMKLEEVQLAVPVIEVRRRLK